jgi:predicted ATPase
MQLWNSIAKGSGRTVLIIGEPGIGKSRLIQALKEEIGETHGGIVTLYCSEHARNTPLFPITEYVQELLRFAEDDGPEARLQKLRTGLHYFPADASEILPLLAALLDVPMPAEYPALSLSNKARRLRTMDLLVSAFLLRGRAAPLLLVVENLHWADASTLELIALLLRRVQDASVMVMLSARPEFQITVDEGSPFDSISLSRLQPIHAKAIVTHIAGGKIFPDSILEQLVDRSEGVPLYIEELTKMLIDTGELEHHGSSGAAQGSPIPVSLRSSLMARLDRLGSAKVTAQIAAILGRTFSFDVLYAASSSTEEKIRNELLQLLRSEIVIQWGEPERDMFRFKHVLIRDVAYESLLKAERRELHQKVAGILTGKFPNTVGTMPELIAQHYASAGLLEEAIEYWTLAGRRALERSSNLEAIGHLTEAITALSRLPASRLRDQLEITAQIALGTAATAAMGYAAAPAESAFARARSISERLEESPQLFSALRGLQSYYIVHGPLVSAIKIGRDLLRRAKKDGDPFLLTEAYRAFGWAMFCAGKMLSGRRHLQRAVELYDLSNAQRHIERLGTDAGVMASANLAWVSWFLGDYALATAQSERAISSARKLGHAHSLAYGLCVSAALYQSFARPHETLRLAAETLELAAKHHFAYWTAWGRILQGWALARLGSKSQGLVAMKEGLSSYLTTGAELFRPYANCLIADVMGQQGEFDGGLELINEAFESGLRSNVHFYDAELLRVQGELLGSRTDHPACINALEASLILSANQRATSLELRTAISLYQRQPMSRKAWVALASASQSIGQETDTSDMRIARTLLEQSG